jgi:solute carrier family 25 (mitochondrial thiamine pyrophosphate transporter), member 19
MIWKTNTYGSSNNNNSNRPSSVRSFQKNSRRKNGPVSLSRNNTSNTTRHKTNSSSSSSNNNIIIENERIIAFIASVGALTTTSWAIMNKQDSKKKGANSYDSIVAGAFAGAIARTLVAPLDVVKIRLQIQKENYKVSNAKYKGAVQAMFQIAKEEGIRKGLWAGTIPALCLWIPYTGIQFGMLDKLNTGLNSTNTNNNQFVNGALAGATATIITYPFDIIRTQLASQGIPRMYNGVFDAFLGLLKRNKLYAGLGITLVEIVPATAVQFGAYEYLKNLEILESNHFAKGFLAGSCARIVIHPLDVMKKRLQVIGLKRAASYGAAETANKAIPLIVSILKTEGVRGFYKGLLPALCKSAPSSAITFGCYEFAMNVLENK